MNCHRWNDNMRRGGDATSGRSFDYEYNSLLPFGPFLKPLFITHILPATTFQVFTSNAGVYSRPISEIIELQ